MVFMKNTPIIGSWVNTASPIAAEVMAAAGFDYLVVDAEHSAVDVSQAQSIFMAIKSGNPSCIPMVRLPGNSYDETKRYLDAGAMGVIAPLINSADEARELVRSVKYPPLGDRGVGYGRSHAYGFGFDDYMATANTSTFVCVQIEHIKGVENLEQIIQVPGIDAAFIGPYDLTASMGITAQFNHQDYKDAVAKILASCKERKLRVGIHVVQPDPAELKQRIDEGFSMIAYSLDITILGSECRRGLQVAREITNHTA